MTRTHIIVEAGVRYWEDATVNGKEDTDGTLIPFRRGDYWHPIIELRTGKVVDWPQGMTADIHYKVCDDGEYWLGDASGKKSAKWTGHYVPNAFLCVGDNGYGDYIILKISGDGSIVEWKQPAIVAAEWKRL